MVWSTALWFHHGLSDHRPESRAAETAGRTPGDQRTPAGRRRHRGVGRPSHGTVAGAARVSRGDRRPPVPAGRRPARPRWRRSRSTSPEVDESQHTDRPWLVIVWNDPINLMSFVTFVFQKLFGYSKEKATKLMLDVHHKGRAVVSSGTRERAELDVYRLHEHGLWATMEQST